MSDLTPITIPNVTRPGHVTFLVTLPTSAVPHQMHVLKRDFGSSAYMDACYSTLINLGATHADIVVEIDGATFTRRQWTNLTTG